MVWDLKKQRPVITLKDPNRCAGKYSCQQRHIQLVQPAQESIRWAAGGLAASISQFWMLQLGSTIAAVPSHTRSCMIPVQPPVHAELSSVCPWLRHAACVCSQRRCSVLQWNPDVATQLVVASEDDRTPTLQMWDLRNSMSPVKEFVGHVKVRVCCCCTFGRGAPVLGCSHC